MLQMDSSKAIVDCLYLFNQSPDHRICTLAEFNEAAVYPLLHGKLRILYDCEMPVSLVTWCWLSNEDSELFVNGGLSVTEDHYKAETGDQLWGFDFIAPFGHAAQTMRYARQLFRNLYGDKIVAHWVRSHSPDKIVVRKM